jgi:hypothetical protein
LVKHRLGCSSRKSKVFLISVHRSFFGSSLNIVQIDNLKKTGKHVLPARMRRLILRSMKIALLKAVIFASSKLMPLLLNADTALKIPTHLEPY